MFDFIDKLDNKQTLAMLIEIDNNYKKLSLKIPAPIYDKSGKLENAREVKQALKLIMPELEKVWDANLGVIDKYSKMTITNNYIVFDLLKTKLNMQVSLISVDKWNKTQDKLLSARKKKIKIKQVIKGNANSLNKKVQKRVNQMYRDGYSWVDTKKELEKEFKYSSDKAKRIAITEKLYYKSEAQLQGIQGLDVFKTWIYNNKAKEPRMFHKIADKQVIRGSEAMFRIGGSKTLAPQHFGNPEEDINCHCTMRIDLVNEVDIAPKEIQEAINRYLS